MTSNLFCNLFPFLINSKYWVAIFKPFKRFLFFIKYELEFISECAFSIYNYDIDTGFYTYEKGDA